MVTPFRTGVFVSLGALYPPGQGGEVEYRVDALDPCVTMTILVRASYLASALHTVTTVQMRVRLR